MKWYENAYEGVKFREVEYEIQVGADTIKTGDQFRVKNTRGTFKFRCLVHNTLADVKWIDCLDNIQGNWRSFRPEQIKGLVKVKAVRRRKKKS